MCGIAGIAAFTEQGRASLDSISLAVPCLGRRGPDANGVYKDTRVALGHTRLSIIDTSSAANQPMSDDSCRYTIIFNGEFFNFKEHRQFVLDKGYVLRTESDTEVLLHLYIIEGEKCLERVNGFFALAIYDKQEQSLFIARDRFGVKPLLIYSDKDKLLFASEMKAMTAMGAPRELDDASLFTYLQLNYIPAPDTVYKGVKKLMPGHCLRFTIYDLRFTMEEKKYYDIPFTKISNLKSQISNDYKEQQKQLAKLLDASVQRRMISDVPLGAFLSGGIDSSVIVALAARHTQKLNTFSIGFRDEPYFDETHYANLVAKKYNTNHHVFSLTTDDLYESLHAALDYMDEPFADSSALNVYLLSRHTRKHVTVALSGDGADELFGGYNKHAAELRVRNGGAFNQLVRLLRPVWKQLPQSRNTAFGNKVRQLNRFAEGMNLSAKERYWRWAGYEEESAARNFLLQQPDEKEYLARKQQILKDIREEGGDMNDVFLTDMHLVLQNDMLFKVDLFSMANSLEVRTPFLDYTVVDFAFSLPSSSKIDRHGRKKIVRDAFRHLLPDEIYQRGKQGFEVPLLRWFRTELKSMITDDLLSPRFISQQGLFQPHAIKELLAKLYSNNPGEAVAQVWALVVFQRWWKKAM